MLRCILPNLQGEIALFVERGANHTSEHSRVITLFLVSAETESSTRLFIRRHSFALSITV
jgi:hypothetical protein